MTIETDFLNCSAEKLAELCSRIETCLGKLSPDQVWMRGTENQKIHCGEQHFAGALGVDFKVVTNADDLP